MDRLVLSDAAWERMAPLIIGRPDQKGSTGRDNRMFVEGVLWIVRTGSPWRDLPEVFGDWNSVFRRFSRWSIKGVWWRIFEAMSDDPDFEYLIVDSTIVRAHQHAAGAKKGGLKIRRIGRSRGGLSTKIHMAVRGLGCPVRFTLTAGQKGDAPQAAALIEGLPAEVVMADTAYDADHLRQAIAAKGAVAVIPNNPSRALKYPLDKHLYAQRHLVECCFSKLKQFRRVATRFEKDRPKLSRRRHSRRHHPMDAISVHTTSDFSCFDAFSSREPVSTSLENALVHCRSKRSRGRWLATAAGAGNLRAGQHPAIGLGGRNDLLIANDDGDFPPFAGPHPRLGNRHQRTGSVHSRTVSFPRSATIRTPYHFPYARLTSGECRLQL